MALMDMIPLDSIIERTERGMLIFRNYTPEPLKTDSDGLILNGIRGKYLFRTTPGW